MPSFNSGAYANHPIQIPPEFPKILKQYTKAAIRTQPKDLLLWSVSYFRYVGLYSNEWMGVPNQPRKKLSPVLMSPLLKRRAFDVSFTCVSLS